MMPVHMPMQELLHCVGAFRSPQFSLHGTQGRVTGLRFLTGFQFMMPPIECGHGLVIVFRIGNVTPFSVHGVQTR